MEDHMNNFRMHLPGTWRKRETSSNVHNINKTSPVIPIWKVPFTYIKENLVEAGGWENKG